MKKQKLNEAVEAYNSEMEYVIKTIIGSITAPGQKKKLLGKAEVIKILDRYGVTIEV